MLAPHCCSIPVLEGGACPWLAPRGRELHRAVSQLAPTAGASPCGLAPVRAGTRGKEQRPVNCLLPPYPQ